MPRRVPIVLILCTLIAACAANTEGNNRDTMTQRQKDSVLGQSGIPGAQGVTKAQRAADSLKAQQARIDSATQP